MSRVWNDSPILLNDREEASFPAVACVFRRLAESYSRNVGIPQSDLRLVYSVSASKKVILFSAVWCTGGPGQQASAA